jgi:hypothetical protein
MHRFFHASALARSCRVGLVVTIGLLTACGSTSAPTTASTSAAVVSVAPAVVASASVSPVTVSTVAASSAVPVSTVEPTSSVTAEPTISTPAPVGVPQLAAVLCAERPTRMSRDAERYTAESWQCAGGYGKVRIDLYAGEDQQRAAGVAVIDFYRAAGDQRSLAELPLLCGVGWGAGFDFNTSRDEALAALGAAGLAVMLCDG